MGKDEGPHYVLKKRGSAHALTHRAQDAPGVFSVHLPSWARVELDPGRKDVFRRPRLGV